MAAINEQVPIAGSNQRLASLQTVAIPGFLDLYCAFVVQTVGKGSGEDFRHMLHNHDWRAIGWQRGKEHSQGLGSASRRTHCNDTIRQPGRERLSFVRKDGISREA